MIYLDNAATTFPKPDSVWEAVLRCGKSAGGNPGRSGHDLAVKAAREVFEAREAVARIFQIRDSSRIVFTLNATAALNTALHGFLRRGDHVIVSSMEHNSVMRPLWTLRGKGWISVSVTPCSPEGELDPEDVRKEIRSATRLIVLTHASNVCGTILPVEAVKRLAPDIPLLVDAAQTAGAVPIDIRSTGIDLLAFSGHKGLYGPMGTGGLYVREGIDLEPMIQGGTGSRSEEWMQPTFLPDALESGTPNVPGLSGLRAGIEFVEAEGLPAIRNHEQTLTRLLMDGVSECRTIRIHGTRTPERQTAVVSMTMDGKDPGEIARRLDRDFGIAVRASLHCAPLAHKTIGTFPQGTVRMSMSRFSTREEVEAAARALIRIAGAQR